MARYWVALKRRASAFGIALAMIVAALAATVLYPFLRSGGVPGVIVGFLTFLSLLATVGTLMAIWLLVRAALDAFAAPHRP